MNSMISAVVLTKNVQSGIKRCLQSLSFADEIVVVDDYSTDKTVSIAKDLGTKVHSRKLAGNFAAQRNFGLNKASHEWILFVDADEMVSKDLQLEIKTELKKAGQGVQGFCLKRQDKFLGHWLSHGETQAVKLLRLGRKEAGKWQDRVHETWKIKGQIKTLEHPLLHDRQIGIAKFMERLSRYARLRAQDLYDQQVRESIGRLLFNPLGKFLHNYGWNLGFLDGFPGLVLAWLMSWHSLLVRLWLQLLWRNDGREIFKPDPKIWQ